MPSLLDPLPDEGQHLVDLVAKVYNMTGAWPVWQYVAQQAYGKHGIDADAALRNLPRWPVAGWYRILRGPHHARRCRQLLTGYRCAHGTDGLLASAVGLVEPVHSGDQLTARLGALADVFDLFLRTADGKSPKAG